MDDAQAVRRDPARSGRRGLVREAEPVGRDPLMATMALLVFVNVVSRYVFNYSIIWSRS